MPRLRRPSAPLCRGPRSAAPARGFTVVELLVALAIASLLLVLAAPPWRARIAAAELRERAEALSAALAAARSEAIKRGTRVDLCASADRLGCAAGGEWEAGWLGFVNDAAAAAPAHGAPLVASERRAREGITIRGNGPVAQYVSYTPLGHARRHDGALQMGTFTVCRRGETALKVVLANSGRTRIDASPEICP